MPLLANDISPRPITNHCIVLDLDNTLVGTADKFETLSELGILNRSDRDALRLRSRIYRLNIIDTFSQKGSGSSFDFWGVTRPHLHEFLTFCFSYFRVVAIWSAGQKAYVEAVVDYIFRDLPPPHIIYTYAETKKENGIIEKPLKEMMKMSVVTQRYMRPNNTFVVDDVELTFERVNKRNGILIPRYEPKMTIPALLKDEVSLLQLKNWFLRKEVIQSKDIRTLDKTHIFSEIS